MGDASAPMPQHEEEANSPNIMVTSVHNWCTAPRTLGRLVMRSPPSRFLASSLGDKGAAPRDRWESLPNSGQGRRLSGSKRQAGTTCSSSRWPFRAPPSLPQQRTLLGPPPRSAFEVARALDTSRGNHLLPQSVGIHPGGQAGTRVTVPVGPKRGAHANAHARAVVGAAALRALYHG